MIAMSNWRFAGGLLVGLSVGFGIGFMAAFESWMRGAEAGRDSFADVQLIHDDSNTVVGVKLKLPETARARKVLRVQRSVERLRKLHAERGLHLQAPSSIEAELPFMTGIDAFNDGVRITWDASKDSEDRFAAVNVRFGKALIRSAEFD
jgi:hypothetical protein